MPHDQVTRAGNRDVEREELNKILRRLSQSIEELRQQSATTPDPVDPDLPLTTDQLPEGTTNLYFTNFRVASALVAGNRISLTTDPFFGNVTIAANLLNQPASNITQGQFADARISESSVKQYEGIVTLPAGEVINGSRVVVSLGGELFLFDPTDPDHGQSVVGVSTEAVTVIGDPVRVKTFGAFTTGSWSDGVVYAGVDGQLTQTPPTSGWLIEVGRVLSPTQIDIDLEPAIQL